MPIEIYAFPPSPRSFKVLLGAELAGIEYELRIVDLSKGEHRTPEIERLNANQRMPVMTDGDYVLWESNAILEYLADCAPAIQLIPIATADRLQVAKWLYWEAAQWDAACFVFDFENVAKPLLGAGDPDEAALAKATSAFERAAIVLELALSNQPYVAGAQLSVADIAIGSALIHADEAKIPYSPFGSVRRWWGALQSLPEWKRAAAHQTSLARRHSRR